MKKNAQWVEIKQLKEKGKLIPFVGAGLSANLELPTSNDLIDIIAKELRWDPQVFRLSGDLNQLAEYYVTVRGSIGRLRSKLDKEFNRTDDEIMNSICHMLLVDCNFPIIYTTNFDNLIERAHYIKEKKYRCIMNLADLAEASDDETLIIKYHGSFEDDHSLVLTEESYFNRLEFESALDIRLRSDTLGKTLLFIGYSFKDINMRYLTYKLNNLRNKEDREVSNPIAVITTFSANDVMKTLWKKRNVGIIELAPLEREDSLSKFLEYLI